MSCEHLVCANCAGPVVEGRCTVCRAARASVHRHGLGGNPQLLLIAVLLLALVAAFVALHGAG